MSTIVDDILALHALCVSASDIASRFHIDQATTLHVIRTGTLPQRQLSLTWRDEPERESQR